jgi:hypothetical protein
MGELAVSGRAVPGTGGVSLSLRPTPLQAADGAAGIYVNRGDCAGLADAVIGWLADQHGPRQRSGPNRAPH